MKVTLTNSRLGFNETSFDRYLLRPRVLRDVTNIDTSAILWGKKTALPLGVAPTAMHRLVHADGEIGTSKACAARGVPMILSALSNDSLEDVVAQSNDDSTPYAIHISPLNKRQVISSILTRAKGTIHSIAEKLHLPVADKIDVQLLDTRLLC